MSLCLEVLKLCRLRLQAVDSHHVAVLTGIPGTLVVCHTMRQTQSGSIPQSSGCFST